MSRCIGVIGSAVLCMVLTTGCGKTEPPAATPDANAPKEALAQAYAALARGDREAFLASVTGTEAERACFEAMADAAAAFVELDALCLSRFGAPGRDSMGAIRMMRYGFHHETMPAEAEVTIEGDRATVRSGAAEPTALVKVDGVWKLSGADLTASDGDMTPEKMTVVMKAMSRAIAVGIAEANKPDATAEAVNLTMNDEMRKASEELMQPLREAEAAAKRDAAKK